MTEQTPKAVQRVQKELENQYGIIEVSEPIHDGVAGWDLEIETKHQPNVPETLKEVSISMDNGRGTVTMLGNRRGIDMMLIFYEVEN